MKRTYFLSPTRDHPPNGPISLGNLIKSPRSPEFPLNNPSSPTIQRLATSAHKTDELHATRSLNISLTLKPGVWTAFLSTLGLSPSGAPALGFDFNINNQDGIMYSTPKLSTHTINPTLSDIHSIFSEEGVQEIVKKSRFSSNLYLVTGVQIAHGAEYIVTKVRERGGNLHLAADVGTPAAGVPVTVGAGVEGNWAREDRAGGRVEGEFVFSYCLREVVYRRKRVVEQRASRVQGDLMGLEGGSGVGNLKGGKGEVFEAEFAGFKEEDPELPDYWDMDIQGGVEDLDGSLCQVVRVDDGDSDEELAGLMYERCRRVVD